MESLEILRGVETPEQLWVQALEPRDIELGNEVGSLEPPRVDRAGDEGQSRSPVGATDRLGTPIDARDRSVAGARGGHRRLGDVLGDVRHVTRDGKHDLVARGDEAGFE